eukprot:g27286.t1
MGRDYVLEAVAGGRWKGLGLYMVRNEREGVLVCWNSVQYNGSEEVEVTGINDHERFLNEMPGSATDGSKGCLEAVPVDFDEQACSLPA